MAFIYTIIIGNEVTFMVGFSDVSHFISLFKNQYGQTPKQF
ncbi:MAG: AraC family transcriptional regulator [Labilibaculum sp.]|nr:AraC family transcriptional regulator [Labilibaculum sp.]